MGPSCGRVPTLQCNVLPLVMLRYCTDDRLAVVLVVLAQPLHLGMQLPVEAAQLIQLRACAHTP